MVRKFSRLLEASLLEPSADMTATELMRIGAGVGRGWGWYVMC